MQKLILTLITAVMILTGCNKSNQFKVKINLENADDQTVYLVKSLDGKTPVSVDTAVFAGNKAELQADFDDPHAVYILWFKEAEEHLILFPENQDVTIKGDINDFIHVEATGSKAQNDYNDYQKGLTQFIVKFAPLEIEGDVAYNTGDSLRYEEINAEMLAIWDEYHEYQFDYIRNHPDSYIAHYILDELKYDIELAEVQALAEILTAESVYSQNVKTFIKQHERVEIGQPFIDFTLRTIDGDEVNLAEVIKNNKVTIVDFWASWCGPCRNENPVMKAAYEKYHDKGLEVIGVSVDRKEAAWLDAVDEDALPYIQVRDADGVVANDYVIVYIPASFMYDQNGVMIAKGLRGEELEAKLAEVL